jgi:phosphatidylglycerophosphatase A
MSRLRVWIATSGGVGYAPVAPGTAGSLVGVGIYFLTWTLPLAYHFAIVVAVTLVGIWASNEAARFFGKPDPSPAVIDEVAGQLLTLLGTGAGPLGALLGFLLFRALDIWKPWPARQLEALHGGLGIMADDLMAAAYGCGILHLVLWLAPWMR